MIPSPFYLLQKFPLRDFILSGSSALLLVLAFPQTEIWILAWIGLIPFMLAIDGKQIGQAFRRGYIIGILFFAGTLYWFIHMSASAGIPVALALLAVILLVLYLALYFGLFAVGYIFFQRRSILSRIFLLPSLWVILEFIRDRLFTGFGWVNLGHSQYKILEMIQIADITGVAGISFIIVMVNVFLKELIGLRWQVLEQKRIILAGVIVVLVLAGVGLYGKRVLTQSWVGSSTSVRVAIIQPNIVQSRKWIPEEWPGILDELLRLTYRVAVNNPDIIVWPETSFPGYIWEDRTALAAVEQTVREIGIPLFFGAITKEQEKYFNSAILMSAKGKMVGRYDKMHLVPFGEYIPLRRYLPFLGSLIPILDFSSGNKVVLFSLRPERTDDIAVLICFEDTIPRVTRRAVQAGAGLLLNITNDAWFLDTKEPFLHLQSAVFRAVENRRNLIRVANTGISCFIDPAGRIGPLVHDPKGKKTFVSGIQMADVALQEQETFYTKHGDIFVLFCLLGVLAGMFVVKKSQY